MFSASIISQIIGKHKRNCIFITKIDNIYAI